jgi:hypothetical protein
VWVAGVPIATPALSVARLEKATGTGVMTNPKGVVVFATSDEPYTNLSQSLAQSVSQFT